MTEVRDAIAAILDNMTLEQFVASGARIEPEKEEFPISAAS
jgi:DNA-binding IscR family transcriptional regulator